MASFIYTHQLPLLEATGNLIAFKAEESLLQHSLFSVLK
jgi:hypothetical protein